MTEKSLQDTWIAGQIEESYGEFTWMDGTKWDFDNWDQGKSQFHDCFLISRPAVFRRTRQEKFWTRAPRVCIFGQKLVKFGQMVGWGLFLEKLELRLCL